MPECQKQNPSENKRVGLRWKPPPTTCLFFLVAYLSATQAAATCSRDDIDYYLNKGFSREQITAICEGGDRNDRQQDSYQAYKNPLEEYTRQDRQRRRIEEEVSFMKQALKVWDVELTPERLEYTRKFCLSAGKTAEIWGRTKVCPDVRYHIYFKDLDVGGHSRKYFYLGSREITVSGTVVRKMLHDLSEYPADIKRELLGSYRHAIKSGATAIPVRRDAPINRVTDILRKYARLNQTRAKSGKPRSSPRP